MALFEQTGEITALAGVDFLTISPNLLEELKNDTSAVPKKLDASAGQYCANKSLAHDTNALSTTALKGEQIPKVTYVDNEAEFRWALCEDEMANDKLHEGIRKFAQDGEALKSVLRKKLSA